MITGKGRLAFAFSILIVYLGATCASVKSAAAPCQTCLQTGGRQVEKGAAQLENTYWKLIEINGQPVAASVQRREPHLRLNSEGKTVEGSGGCNTLRGGYQLDGDRLRFGRIATTRMACPDPYMSQENAYLKALNATDFFKLSGDKLELRGDGKSLARFEARQMK